MTNMGLSELDDLVDMGATAYKGRVNQDFRVSTTVVMQKFNSTHTIKYFAYAKSELLDF